jgi:hypothetical protein
MTTEQRAATLRALADLVGFDALVVLLTDPTAWFDDNAIDLADQWEAPFGDDESPDPLAVAIAGGEPGEVTAALRVALGDGFAAETTTS